MIRINKSANVPVPLDGEASLGGQAKQRMIDAMEAGEDLPEFQSSIYAHRIVKEQLIRDQHDKCAYCERADVTANFHGDVEHVRPKAGWVQRVGDALSRSGYYWLAYDWDNLLFSCQHCNQTHKKNLFPLRAPKKRSLSHHEDVAREQPILVNPTREDPSEFIEFREELPVGKDRGGRGKRTIAILGLDRPKLNETRRKLLNRVHEMQDLLLAFEGRPLDKDQAKAIAACQEFLRHCVEDNHEFAAMCRCALSDS